MRSLILAAAGLLFGWAAPFGIGGKATANVSKTIALSFDDMPRGPGTFMTVEQRNLRLIAALKQAQVDQAVFFTNPGRSRWPTPWRASRRAASMGTSLQPLGKADRP